MMECYDPLESPPPEEWLDMDEAERLSLVEDYHRRALYRARSFPSPCRRLAPILLISSFAIAWRVQSAIGFGGRVSCITPQRRCHSAPTASSRNRH